MHRANDAHVIHVLGDVGKYVTDFNSGLAVLLEAVGRWKSCSGFPLRRQVERNDLTRVLLKGRLGVERVDLGRAAVHEEKDNALGFSWKWRLMRGHGVVRAHRVLSLSGSEGRLGSQQPHQAEGGKAVADAADKL